MDVAALLAFAAILFVAAASPGPAIAAVVARVLGRGTDGAVAFTAGLAIGDVVWLTCAIFGLAALAQSFHGLFVALKLVGAAYLLYLAWRLWTSPVVAHEIASRSAGESTAKLFLAGVALTLGNPKVMVFYLALLPTVLDVAAVTALGYAELVAVTLSVLALVFAGYIVLAARARRLLTSPRALRFVNRVTGLAMAGTAAAVATR